MSLYFVLKYNIRRMKAEADKDWGCETSYRKSPLQAFKMLICWTFEQIQQFVKFVEIKYFRTNESRQVSSFQNKRQFEWMVGCQIQTRLNTDHEKENSIIGHDF